MSKRLGVVDYLNSIPLVYALEKKHIEYPFELIYDVPSVCAQKLSDGEIDLGLIPSIEFARSVGHYCIIPNVCIASYGKVESVLLFFNRNLDNIKKVALDTSSRTSVVLTQIILQEKYEVDAEYIDAEPDLEHMLSIADAALVIGDKALEYSEQYESKLDLGEEWTDMTGLPFVYAFWAGPHGVLNANEMRLIQHAAKIGKDFNDEIAKAYAKGEKRKEKFYVTYLSKNIRYSFGEKEEQGLEEFFYYAFYYNLITSIPSIRYFGDD